MKTSCRRWPQDCARLPIPPSKPWGVFWSAPRWRRTWSWDRFRFPSECCLSSLSLALMLCRRYEKQKKSLLKNVEKKRGNKYFMYSIIHSRLSVSLFHVLSYTVVCLSLYFMYSVIHSHLSVSQAISCLSCCYLFLLLITCLPPFRLWSSKWLPVLCL